MRTSDSCIGFFSQSDPDVPEAQGRMVHDTVAGTDEFGYASGNVRKRDCSCSNLPCPSNYPTPASVSGCSVNSTLTDKYACKDE